MKSFKLYTLLAAVASCNDFSHALTTYPSVEIDSRSLDDIYAAAKQESGPLQVFWGGDGKCPDSLL